MRLRSYFSTLSTAIAALAIASCGSGDSVLVFVPAAQTPDATTEPAPPSDDASSTTPDASTSPISDAAIARADASCNATDPRAVPATLFVQPEDRDKTIVAKITAAQKSVRATVYLISAGPILTALKQKAQAGVKVRAIFDK